MEQWEVKMLKVDEILLSDVRRIGGAERTGGCVGFAEGRRSRGDRPTGARMSVV